ncbi:MAG: GDSL-type esterase/lipase family protein [Myxococcaceae bacterium]|nr:GDSL-type esterase/lipase family protein [Myxococcaceae bacterium]
MGTLALLVLVACGCGTGTGAPDAGPSDDAPLPPRLQAAPPGLTELQPPPLQAFQPGFHQALRATENVAGLTTFRMRVPVSRTGNRVRVVFKSGAGALRVERATVAHAGASGALAEPPLALMFGGQPGFDTGPLTRVASDAVELSVQAGDDLAISFAATGALAASALGILPDSHARTGFHVSVQGPIGGTEHAVAVGVNTVDVEGPPGLSFVAIGDSITEGYIGGGEDYRVAWPGVASSLTGVPVVNAGVSGQGTWGALESLDVDVLALTGTTDCIVLLGTNDLGGSFPVSELKGRLAELFARLDPFCRVWAGTLLPKEPAGVDLAQLWAERTDVNTWLRTEAHVDGVVEFEQAVAEPANPNRFRPGLSRDGIHPNSEGQALLGEEAAKLVRALSGAGSQPKAP